MNKLKIPSIICTLTLALAMGGCAATQPAPQQTTPATTGSTDNGTTGAAQKQPQNSLAKAMAETAAKARTTMRSQTVKYQETTIEATPMWSMNYQGEVHIRIYDAAGNLIRDEISKP